MAQINITSNQGEILQWWLVTIRLKQPHDIMPKIIYTQFWT